MRDGRRGPREKVFCSKPLSRLPSCSPPPGSGLPASGHIARPKGHQGRLGFSGEEGPRVPTATAGVRPRRATGGAGAARDVAAAARRLAGRFDVVYWDAGECPDVAADGDGGSDDDDGDGVDVDPSEGGTRGGAPGGGGGGGGGGVACNRGGSRMPPCGPDPAATPTSRRRRGEPRRGGVVQDGRWRQSGWGDGEGRGGGVSGKRRWNGGVYEPQRRGGGGAACGGLDSGGDVRRRRAVQCPGTGAESGFIASQQSLCAGTRAMSHSRIHQACPHEHARRDSRALTRRALDTRTTPAWQVGSTRHLPPGL